MTNKRPYYPSLIGVDTVIRKKLVAVDTRKINGSMDRSVS